MAEKALDRTTWSEFKQHSALPRTRQWLLPMWLLTDTSLLVTSAVHACAVATAASASRWRCSSSSWDRNADLSKGGASSWVLVPALLHEHDVLGVALEDAAAWQIRWCRQLRPLSSLCHQCHHLHTQVANAQDTPPTTSQPRRVLFSFFLSFFLSFSGKKNC